MKTVYERSQSYLGGHELCAGCMHSLINKLVVDMIDELEIPKDKVVLSFSPGCGAQPHIVMNFNILLPGLGRSAAAGTGFKRVNPDHFFLCWDGDGADAAIGIGDVIHAAARGENITVLMVNNSLFANTGGQMAPTTLVGQRSATSPRGRNAAVDGYPVNLAEILAEVEGTRYSARVAVFDPRQVVNAKKALRKAFQIQRNRQGFSYVEFVSNCPVNWHMTPIETIGYIKDTMLKQFPLGEFKDRN